MIEYIHILDTNILHSIQAIGPYWYDTAWLLSFVIGSTQWLAPISIAALLLIGKKRTAIEIFFIFLASAAFLVVAKHFIDAPRPYQVDSSVVQYATETSSGMPSGHAFLAMIIFGWLWFRHPKSLFLSVSTGVLIFMIGLSRIYLGLHYPSQVLVGWVLGLIALFVFWWVDKIYFRSRSSYVSKEKRRSR